MKQRLIKVLDLLQAKHLDALLVSSSSNITYLTGYSHFSLIEREAYLFITKSKQYIITDTRYSEAVIEKIPHFELIERTPTQPYHYIFRKLKKAHAIKILGIEEDSLSVAEYRLIEKYFKKTTHLNVSSLRTLKNKPEINAIEKACQLGDKTFEFILKKIKSGITEKELAFELELFIKRHGANTSFDSIVAFGKNSSVPHHQTGDTKLESNSFVLLDFGVKLNNYCSDMARTVFFGKSTTKQKRMYNTVLKAQQLAFANLKSLIINPKSKIDNASVIDLMARKYIKQQGFPSIPHSLGHGIGLEVHEKPILGPSSKDVLKREMVFSLEPGIYIPKFGGIRIEDLVVLEEGGPRLLTHSPRNLIEL